MIYFVTENWLKTKIPLTANIDMAKVFPYVESQADMRLQPILGTYFYTYLLGKYNAQTLTVDEQNLVKKIQYAIGWRAIEDCILGISFELKNKGIQQQSGDYSNPTTLSEANYIEGRMAKKAEFYEERLIKWLQANSSLFPQFLDEQNDSDMKPIKATNTGYNESIFFM